MKLNTQNNEVKKKGRKRNVQPTTKKGKEILETAGQTMFKKHLKKE